MASHVTALISVLAVFLLFDLQADCFILLLANFVRSSLNLYGNDDLTMTLAIVKPVLRWFVSRVVGVQTACCVFVVWTVLFSS